MKFVNIACSGIGDNTIYFTTTRPLAHLHSISSLVRGAASHDHEYETI